MHMAERFNRALAKVLTEADVKLKISAPSMEIAPTTLPEAAAEFRTAAANQRTTRCAINTWSVHVSIAARRVR